jgi:hypothetical protein
LNKNPIEETKKIDNPSFQNPVAANTKHKHKQDGVVYELRD